MSGFRQETRPQRNTDGIMPRFHVTAVQDHIATAQEGRAIFVDEERVQIIIPGRGDSPVERVNDDHKGRWPDEYAAFKRNRDVSITGVPLEVWSAMTPATVAELKFLGFATVEQCAAMSDQAAQKIRLGGTRIRDLAKAYLDDAFAAAEQNRLMAERDKQAAELNELRAKVAELGGLVNSLHQQRMASQQRPSDVESHVPAQHNRIDMALSVPSNEPVAQSALASMPEVRRRPGRPSNAELAARAQPEAP